MAKEPRMVASAVIVPEGTGISTSPTSNDNPSKRRQSSSSSHHSKRPRLDIDRSLQDKNDDKQPAKSPPPTSASPSTQAPPIRRRSVRDEERGRNKRLFGALMGTLSQSSKPTFGTKRAEIERKQQARFREQAAERDEQKRRELAVLNRKRQSQQKVVDEQALELKHSNSRASANFLHTKTGPRLYYKPYKLIPHQEARIQGQIEDTEAVIKEEMQAFGLDTTKGRQASKQGQKGRRRRTVSQPGQAIQKGEERMLPRDVNHPVSNDKQGHDEVEGKAASGNTHEGADLEDDAEDNEDVVAEPGEDAVIY